MTFAWGWGPGEQQRDADDCIESALRWAGGVLSAFLYFAWGPTPTRGVPASGRLLLTAKLSRGVLWKSSRPPPERVHAIVQACVRSGCELDL